MEEIEAIMAELSKLHGRDGMRAVASLMYSLGSGTTINFDDGTWIPCDFLMQMAWANGGEPETKTERIAGQ